MLTIYTVFLNGLRMVGSRRNQWER